MFKVLIREVMIYLTLLIFLAFLMHPDLLSAPSERIELMQNRGNYFHPLYYSLIVYLFILAIRYIARKFIQIILNFKKREKEN